MPGKRKKTTQRDNAKAHKKKKKEKLKLAARKSQKKNVKKKTDCGNEWEDLEKLLISRI